MVFAPLSELYGRKIMYVGTLLIGVVFVIPGAVAKNIGTLLSGRFLCGLFASSSLVIAGGTISDIWVCTVLCTLSLWLTSSQDNNERGFAIAL